jgi:hypothetical protein
MDFEKKQREEIDSLNTIYEGDIKLLRSQFPFKIQIDIRPFLEQENLILPWDYPELFVSVIVDMGKEYPKNKPIISFFSNRKSFLKSEKMIKLQKEYNANFENRKQDFLLMEVVEKIREELYLEVKNNYKQFRKIRHFLEEVQEEMEDIHLAPTENVENLSKKDTYTPLTPENFNEWNEKFLREVRLKMKKDRRKKVDMKKPTGREIFQDTMNLLFVDDDDEEEEEEEVQVDEDVFGEEDDLDELNFD